MALGTELFQLATSYDPYGAFREGQMEGQKYDIEQQKLDVQQQAMKEAKQEMAAESKPQPLAGMSKSMMPPGTQLETADGIPTSSGLLNQQLVNSQQDLAASQKMMKEANVARAMGDNKAYANLVSEARRLQTTATTNMANARKEYQASIDDALESVYGANSQQEYDQRVKDALTRTGIVPPKNLPEIWSPDVKEKILSAMSPATRTKVEKEQRAEEKAKRDERTAALRDQRLEALLRNGQGGGEGKSSKVYDTLDEKVSDPNYGVAKGKVPAKEQTIARRINTDAKEVVTGVDQVMTLTNGGMRDTTGTTFANVKDNGLLTAPAKFFTNKISDKDSAMYDAMMYPLVKGIALYANPDYRPTEADVKNAMNSYKAQSGQPQSVQLEKMAELKKNFLAASESYLDSGILNPQQANSLKQQIKAVEKAIPWDVNDVVNFTRSGKKDFGSYLQDKGVNVSSSKKEESKSPTVTTQEQYDALPSGSVYIEDGKKYRKP